MRTIDLAKTTLRALNASLHEQQRAMTEREWRIANPNGQHAVAVGVDAPLLIEIDGHVGYYCGGMNKRASIKVNGNTGPGVAENMMSGLVRICGTPVRAPARRVAAAFWSLKETRAPVAASR